MAILQLLLYGWIAGAAVSGIGLLWFVPSARTVFRTDDWLFFLSVLILSFLWPIYFTSVGLRAGWYYLTRRGVR